MANRRRPNPDPKPMGELVRTLVAGRGWAERMALGRLADAWGSVVGEHVARRSRPLSLVRGTLTIGAEGGAWATELTLLGPSLASKADAFLGGDPPVKQVRVTGGSRRPSGRGRAGSSGAS